MRFKDGFKVGSHGGHGPIQYIIRNLTPGEFIEFEFTKPEGFRGVRLTHFLRMRTSTLGGLQWILAIRWLHDALTEDAFDQIENQFSSKTKETEWSPWVKILRRIL
ncbi:MAG: hypothetical protein OEQ53_06200 [Saprospiraceae bacterium]|nr:hypothetical protein [Saprospiraceae bacterium]